MEQELKVSFPPPPAVRTADLPGYREKTDGNPFWVWILFTFSVLMFATAISQLVLGFDSPGVTLRHFMAASGCGTARALGFPPAHPGEPGYWVWLDKDGDGFACEEDESPRPAA